MPCKRKQRQQSSGHSMVPQAGVLYSVPCPCWACCRRCSSGDEERGLPHRPDFFHCVLLLASAYLVMVFTGWDLSGEESDLTVDKG